MSLNRLSHGIQKSRIENAIVDEGRKLIYFWSEKCACTSVVTAAFDSIGKLQEALTHHPWIHNYRQKIHNPRFGMSLSDFKDRHQRYRKIYFVRNPYSRIASCYFHFTAAAESRGAESNEWTQQSFSKFVDFLESNSSIRDSELDDVLADDKKLKCTKRAVISHSKLQVPAEDCILNESIDTVVKIEDIETNSEYFKNIGLGHLDEKHFKIGNSFHHFSNHNGESSGPVYHSLYLENGIRERVRLLYDSDLSRLKYSWEDFAPAADKS